MADQGLDLSPYLAQLEQQRATLTIQIAGVRAAMGLPPEDGSAATASIALSGGITPSGSVTNRTGPGQIRQDEFFRMSIPESIRRYLEIMKQPQAPTVIVAALKAGGVLSTSKNFYTTVWTAMKRLKASGEIVNTNRGWGLSEWYPNKPKVSETGKPKGTSKSAKGKTARGTKAMAKRAPTAKAPKAAPRKRVRKPDAYHAFLRDYMKGSGKTMAEAIKAYQAQKARA